MIASKTLSFDGFTLQKRPKNIGQHALACDGLFRELFSKNDTNSRQNSSDINQNRLLREYERFKLWASNIGVFAEVQSSLDSRLRDLDDIKDSFLAQLILIERRLFQLSHSPLSCYNDSLDAPDKAFGQADHEEPIPMLSQNVAEGRPSSPLSTRKTEVVDEKQNRQDEDPYENQGPDLPDGPQSWDEARLLLSIGRSIEWLQRLSNLVRKASFASQDRKAEMFELDDQEFRVEGLREFYSWYLKREFQDLREPLLRRLVESMVVRRKRFEYRQKQQRPLDILPNKALAEETGLIMTTGPDDSSHASPGPTENHSSPKPNAGSQARIGHPAKSNLSMPTVDGELFRRLITPSRISKATTALMSEDTKALIPPPPREVDVKDTFTCPYCYLLLPSNVALTAVSWGNHVMMDLHPYVCVVDDCVGPVEIYASSKDWLTHMRSCHFTRWYCRAKPHELPVEFQCQTDFIEHMNIEHPGKFRESQLPYIAQRSSRSPDSIFDACPFCPTTSGELEAHIGEHLRNLALKVLPRPQDDLVDDADSIIESYEEITIASDATKRNNKESSEMPDLVFDQDPQEGALFARKGARLSEYGFITKITQQHSDLELSEQQRDPLLAHLVMHTSSGMPGMHRKTRSFTVPCLRDADFVPRRDLMDQIHEKLSSPAAIVALVGLGGTGKSQLAIEYAYQLGEQSAEISVLWLCASNAARFEQSIRENLIALGLPGRDTIDADPYELFSRWLGSEASGRWLLVVDNADDISFLQEAPTESLTRTSTTLMPWMLNLLSVSECNHGATLITTRSRLTAIRFAAYKNIIYVDAMNEVDSAVLLARNLPPHSYYDDAELEKLAVAMGFLPLALTQAAAYIRSRPTYTIHKYLGKFHKSVESAASLLNHDMRDERRDIGASNSILFTWQISFQHLQHIRPSAADLLSLMSFCDCEEIPTFLFVVRGEQQSNKEVSVGDAADSIHGPRPPSGDASEGEDLQKDETDRIGSTLRTAEYHNNFESYEYEDDLENLLGLSFISIDVGGQNCSMHRLVQLATQTWLESEGQFERSQSRFICSLDAAFPGADFKNWGVCASLFPHAKKAMNSRPLNEDALLHWSAIMHKSAEYALEKGAWSDAESMVKHCIEARESLLGSEDPRTLESLLLLATITKDRGKWYEVEKLQILILTTAKRVLGEHHSTTLRAMNDLAALYQAQGRWTEAEQFGQQVLESLRAMFGEAHPDTLTSMDNLASIYRAQGRWKEAEHLGVIAISVRQRVLGEGHPDTLLCMNSLASTYIYQGRWKEAEVLEVQVLKAISKVLGKEHPNTLTGMASLALIYRYQDRGKEAETLEEQVLETRSRVLGEEHPDTLASMANLALVYRDLDRRREAEKLEEQVLETRSRVLGKEHPDTLTSMANLASKYRDQGRLIQAEELDMQVLETRRRLFGEEHPDTITSMNSLAQTLKLMGHDNEALQLMSSVCELGTKILGLEHPRAISYQSTYEQWSY